MSIYSMGQAGGTDFDILGYAASGMEAQRGALDVAAHNIALAQTADPDHPVKAYAPVFSVNPSSLASNPFASMVKAASDSDNDDEMVSDDDDDDTSGAADAATTGIGQSGIVSMTGVKQTNIDSNAITQMVDMLNAQRAYESNASVFDVGKSVMEKTLTLGQ